MNKPLSDPHLFTVRVWLEEIDTGQVECRGRIQYGLDGPAWHFQGWAALIDLMHNVVRPVADVVRTESNPVRPVADVVRTESDPVRPVADVVRTESDPVRPENPDGRQDEART